MEQAKICQWFHVCPIKRFTEREILDKKWVEEYCKSNYWRCVRRKMQEEGLYHPDNMLPDGTIDKHLH